MLFSELEYILHMMKFHPIPTISTHEILLILQSSIHTKLMSNMCPVPAPSIPNILFRSSIKHYLGVLQLASENFLPLSTAPGQLFEVWRLHTICFNHHHRNSIYVMLYFLPNAFPSIILFAHDKISMKDILLSPPILWMMKLQLREIEWLASEWGSWDLNLDAMYLNLVLSLYCLTRH